MIADRCVVAGLLVIMGSCLARLPVRADAIQPAPEECPPGTYPRTDHGGARCEPRFCGRDVSPQSAVPCDVGSSCRDGFVRFHVVAPIDYARPGFPTVSAFEGDCECPLETCSRGDLCVPDTLPIERCHGATPPRDDAPAQPPRGGCASCEVSAQGHAAACTTALFVLALAAWRARPRGVVRDDGADGSRTRTSRI